MKINKKIFKLLLLFPILIFISSFIGREIIYSKNGSVTIVDSIQVKTCFMNNKDNCNFNLEILNLGSSPVFIDTFDLQDEIILQNKTKVLSFDQRISDLHGNPINITLLKPNQIFSKSFLIHENLNYYSLGIKYLNSACNGYNKMYEKYKKGETEFKIGRSFFDTESRFFFTTNMIKE